MTPNESPEAVLKDGKEAPKEGEGQPAVAASPSDEDDTHDSSTDHRARPQDAPQPPSTGFFLALSQIRALVYKNFLTKLRTPFSTLLEIWTPVGMMLILVAAYGLSDITYKDAQTYSNITVAVPGPWLDLWRVAADWNNSNLVLEDKEQRRLYQSEETFVRNTPWKLEDLLHHDHDGTNTCHAKKAVKGFAAWPVPLENTDAQPRHLQIVEDEDDSDTDDFTWEEGDDVYDLLDQAHGQITNLLKNPLWVPSLTEYVALSQALGSLVNTSDLPRVWSESSYGREWGNLLFTNSTLHMVGASPDSSPFAADLVDALHAYLKDMLDPLATVGVDVPIRWHASVDAALQYIDDHLDERTWALIDVTDWTNQSHPEYKIRMNYTTIPNTNEIVDFVSIGLNTDYQQYYLSGYLTLQRTLNEFAFDFYGGECAATVSSIGQTWSMPMPTAAYSQNSFFLAVGYLLGLTIAMAFLYPVSRLIKSIVEEKETRMRETLYILGVKPWALWWSWFISAVIVFFVVAILVTRTLAANILKHSAPGYLFALIGLFSMSCIGFCFTIASLFSKAKLASIVGPMALFATLLREC